MDIHKGISRDSPEKKQKKKAYSYGQLNIEKADVNTKKIALKTFFGNPEQEVFCLKFDYEDQLIAAGCSDGSIKVFSMATGKLAYNLMGSSVGESPTTTIRWRPEIQGKTKSVFLSGNSDGNLLFWHATSGKQLHRIVEQDNQILALDMRKDGSIFATGGKDFKLRIYDDEKKEVIRVMEPADLNQAGHSNRVFSIKFIHDDINLLMSGGWDANVLLWDLRQPKSIGNIFGPNLTGDSLDYKNGQVLTGSYRTKDQLQIWDFKTQSLLREVQWQPGSQLNDFYIYTCQFSKVDNDTIMAGSSGRQEVKVFDTRQDYKPCGCIADLEDGVYALDYGNCSNKFAFGGGEGVIYICSLINQKNN